jgi:hypothetical protein
VAALPDIPYGFPSSSAGATGVTHPFAAEQSGGLQKMWLQRLPHQVATRQVQSERYLPNKEDFWRSPPYEALREIVLRSAYHDALKIIMEHDYTFLLVDVMCNDEAPMPHVIYEDFMKVLTFSSKQRPPEEQFALPDNILRDLLCWAAYYCTLDSFYFTSASLFFHKVEQEQHLSPALHSAWVYICTAAGRIDEAVAYSVYMDRHKIPFDPVVFSFMLHPSLTPTQLHLHHAPQTAKGVVLQRRLCQDMHQHHGTAAVATHAMFVYHMLTLRHTRKWEVLRSAAEIALLQRRPQPSATTAVVSAAAVPDEMISSRTMQLALSAFTREKGVRWGPRTTKAMVSFMVADDSAGVTVADVVYVLMRIRRNERTSVLAQLPHTVFSEQEQAALMAVVRQRCRSDPTWSVATPLLHELVASDSTSVEEVVTKSSPQRGKDQGVLHALRDLQELSSLSLGGKGSEAASSAQPSTRSHLGGSDAVVPSSASWLTEDAGEPAPTELAEVARELLEAVMKLDRESVQREGESKKASTTAAAHADTSSADTPAAALAKEAEQLAALQASMEAIGTSASLASWSMQQAEHEAEEARLRSQVSTAWIAPTYRP